MLPLDKSWTLFLDRDGVINFEKEADYIHTWEEFQFYPGAIEAIVQCSQWFARVIVVTNQKGIGKGVTKPENLETIHRNMKTAIEKAGGRMDAIYFCPDTDNNSPNRKPNAGMAFQAKADFPMINFAKSLMVGNNISDLKFARNAGMYAAFLRTTKPDLELPEGLCDVEAKDLTQLAAILAQYFNDC